MKITPSLTVRFIRVAAPQLLRSRDAALAEIAGMAKPSSEGKIIEIMAKLLRQGARIDAKDAHGMTPLAHFCAKGLGKAAAFALENNARIYDAGSTHGSAFEAAIETFSDTALRALIENSKKFPLGTDAYYTNALTRLFDRADKKLDTAQMVRAVACGTLLLEAGAEMSVYKQRDVFTKLPGLAPLVPGMSEKVALADAIKAEDNTSVKWLLEKGIHPDCYVDIAGSVDTPLLKAVKRNDTALIELLLAHKADPNLVPYDWAESPMRFAARNGLRPAFLLLLEAGGEEYGHTSDGKPAKPGDPGLAQLALNGGFPNFSTFVEETLAAREKARMEKALETMAVDKAVKVLKAPIRFKPAAPKA